jgi:hypothetical protein
MPLFWAKNAGATRRKRAYGVCWRDRGSEGVPLAHQEQDISRSLLCTCHKPHISVLDVGFCQKRKMSYLGLPCYGQLTDLPTQRLHVSPDIDFGRLPRTAAWDTKLLGVTQSPHTILTAVPVASSTSNLDWPL